MRESALSIPHSLRESGHFLKQSGSEERGPLHKSGKQKEKTVQEVAEVAE